MTWNKLGRTAIRRFALEQLCRHYRMGETVIRAVDGVLWKCVRENLWLSSAVQAPENLQY